MVEMKNPSVEVSNIQEIDSIVFSQVLGMVDIGLVILDRELRVRYWNRWMQLHSGIEPEHILGSAVCDAFPNLKRPRFLNNCKAVLTFGNFCFFSQKLHRFLFPLKPISSFDGDFEYMQQSCTMGPLRNKEDQIEYLFIAVHDVTETVNFEKKLMELNPMRMNRLIQFIQSIRKDFPGSTFWMDYLAENRICALDSLPRTFGINPARFQQKIGYLGTTKRKK